MKWITIVIASLGMVNVQASYYEENCATADGTSRWERGHNANKIYFRSQNVQTGEWVESEFSAYEVTFKLDKKKTIKKKSSGGECWVGEDHWYSATATVRPSPEIKDEFKKAFPTGNFTDFVICHDQYSGETCKR